MENKKTCLYDKHVALGALISPFGGFDMPIQYTNIIDEQGVEYLQRSPYAVYQKLISEKARSDYARLVLITLLCNASVKAGEMDEAELSKDLQNSCFLRKKAADEIAAMYKSLFSEENISSWKKKEYAGFKEFCECTWEFEWEGSGKWSR